MSSKARTSFSEKHPRMARFLDKTVERNGEEVEAGKWIESIAGIDGLTLEKSGKGGLSALGVKLNATEVEYFKHCREVGVPKRTNRKAVEGKPCFCGCGKQTRNAGSMFIPSHDMKLKSLILKVHREVAPASKIPGVVVPFWPQLNLGLDAEILKDVGRMIGASKRSKKVAAA